MNKTTQHSQISLYTLLLTSMLSITLQITGMEPLEQDYNHTTPLQLITLPSEIANIIIAASNNQSALSETCMYLRDFMAKNKETILRQKLLQLNKQALDKFLVHYGALGNGTIASNLLLGEIVGNLLAKGANPNACRIVIVPSGSSFYKISFPDSPLIFDAIKNGHTNMVELLIAHGADIKGKYKRELTFLHYTCKYNHPDIVKMLLEHGVDINAKDSNFNTPLHIASAKGISEIIAILLDNELVDVNAKNRSGVTPLHKACESGNIQVVVQLLQKRAAFNEKDNRGRTPLHYGCEHNNMIKFLVVDNCADINALDNSNLTPLHRASQCGYTQGVKTLLHLGALVDSRDINDRTPLHIASSFGHVDIVEILLDNGADIHATSPLGSSLHHASQNGHIEVIRKLLEKGARINQRGNMSRTPLGLATYHSTMPNEKVKQLLIAHGGVTSGFISDHPETITIASILTSTLVFACLFKALHWIESCSVYSMGT